MIPHKINVDRFRHLLQFGVESATLRQFLQENKKALLAAGVKLDNLPSDAAAARRRIESFSDKAHAVLGKWLTKNAALETLISPSQIEARYREVESGGAPLGADECEQLASAGLIHLYRNPPDANWIRFLCTAVGESSAVDAAMDWKALALWWAKQGPRPAGNDSPAAAVVALEEAIRTRNSALLDPYEVLASVSGLRDIVRAHQDSERNEESSVGPIVLRGPPELRAFDPDVNYSELTVFATRRSASVRDPYFVVVEAFRDDRGQLFTLDHEDIRRAIPTEGRIVLFPDKGFTQPPELGEPIAYQVESLNTDKSIKVKGIGSSPDDLFRVVQMPFGADQAHEIRTYIADYARTRVPRLAVFVTTDHRCVRPPVDDMQRVLAKDFEWQLDMWDRLHAFELSNGSYVLAPLPMPTSKLDCAPLAVSARRLLKTFSERSAVKLLKQQRDLMSEILSEDSALADVVTRKRLLSNVDAIERGTEDFNGLINDLLASQPIRNEVDALVKAEAAALSASRDKERQQVETLRREKENLEKKIIQLSLDAEKKAKAVRAAVQKAFSGAKSHELDSLGDAAFLSALISRDAEKPKSPQREVESIEPRESIVATNQAASGVPLIGVFRSLSLSDATAEKVAAAISLGIKAGLPLVVRGVGARHIGTQLAASLSSKEFLCFDVSIGGTSCHPGIRAIASNAPETLLLRDANLSDLALYAEPVLTEIAKRIVSRKAVTNVWPIVLTESGGPAGLPWPKEVIGAALKIDIESLDRQVEQQNSGPKESHWYRRMVDRLDRGLPAESDQTDVLSLVRNLMDASS